MINTHTRLALRQCEYHDEEAREKSSARITLAQKGLQQVVTALACEQSARAVSTAMIRALGFQIQDWTSAQVEGERSRVRRHEQLVKVARIQGESEAPCARKGDSQPTPAQNETQEQPVKETRCEISGMPVGKAHKRSWQFLTSVRAVRRRQTRCKLGRMNPYGGEGPPKGSDRPLPYQTAQRLREGSESSTPPVKPGSDLGSAEVPGNRRVKPCRGERKVNEEDLCYLCYYPLIADASQHCPSDDCLNQFHGVCIRDKLVGLIEASPAKGPKQPYICPWCVQPGWYFKKKGVLCTMEGKVVPLKRTYKVPPGGYQASPSGPRRTEE